MWKIISDNVCKFYGIVQLKLGRVPPCQMIEGKCIQIKLRGIYYYLLYNSIAVLQTLLKTTTKTLFFHKEWILDKLFRALVDSFILLEIYLRLILLFLSWIKIGKQTQEIVHLCPYVQCEWIKCYFSLSLRYVIRETMCQLTNEWKTILNNDTTCEVSACSLSTIGKIWLSGSLSNLTPM